MATENLAEEITANIERMVSLAEAENVDAMEELHAQTEDLITQLSGKGSIALKKDFRDRLRGAAAAQPKPAPKPDAGAAVAVKDYTEIAGVPELVAEGAQRMAEGVRLHLKASVTAKEIAEITLDMWSRIPDKSGYPDIKGTSAAAKAASKALYEAAGQGFERTLDNENALTSLQRSVQNQRSDVRAEYLRSLDDDSDDAAEDRKRFGALLANKPDGVPASKFIADHYGVKLKGTLELQREAYAQRKELGDGSDEAEELTPDERVAALVRKMKRDVSTAKIDDFEAASDEVKKTAREELIVLGDAVKSMVTALL